MDGPQNARRQRNQRYHQKSKANWDSVSFRLPKGGKSRIDQMAHRFGVPRPALFDVYLLPFLGVIAEHQAELSRLAKEAGCSIPTYLDRLIRVATVEGSEQAPESVPPDVASDFDALFGGPADEPPMGDGGS